MTTIAWDGKTLAADGRTTSETIISCDKSVKLFKLLDIPYYGDILLYAGLCGAAAEQQRYIHFLHIENFFEDEIEVELGGIIVGRDYVYAVEGGPQLCRFPRCTKMAAGSGAHFAMSAMNLGKSAVQAVKHAMKFDAATGGRIQCVDL